MCFTLGECKTALLPLVEHVQQCLRGDRRPTFAHNVLFPADGHFDARQCFTLEAFQMPIRQDVRFFFQFLLAGEDRIQHLAGYWFTILRDASTSREPLPMAAGHDQPRAVSSNPTRVRS